MAFPPNIWVNKSQFRYPLFVVFDRTKQGWRLQKIRRVHDIFFVIENKEVTVFSLKLRMSLVVAINFYFLLTRRTEFNCTVSLTTNDNVFRSSYTPGCLVQQAYKQFEDQRPAYVP